MNQLITAVALILGLSLAAVVLASAGTVTPLALYLFLFCVGLIASVICIWPAWAWLARRVLVALWALVAKPCDDSREEAMK